MNLVLDPRALLDAAPLRRPRMATEVTLGMPELCLGGLSETWLLKACGDRHWRLLAELGRLDRPEFRDEAGDKVYAAFRSLCAEGLRLDRFAEHDVLTLKSEITRVSRTRFLSRHALFRGTEPAGHVELLSAFVKRAEPGRNRSIVRAVVGGFPPPDPFAAGRAIDVAAKLKADRWESHRGFSRAGADLVGRVVAKPCPTQDFNGADLLYFAAIQSFADRAEWELLDLPPAVSTRGREIVFHGNVEPGERIALSLLGHRKRSAGYDGWMRVTRASDDAVLADVFTSRSTPIRLQ